MCNQSMIPLARPTVPPTVITIFKQRLFCVIWKGGDERTGPGMWVGRVDQLGFG